MLSKLKKLASFRKGSKDLIDISSIKNNLSDGLFQVMGNAFDQRKSDTQNSKYGADDVDKIIAEYSKKNMMLAAATSIVPGPFGILGSIPELVLNFKNQMNMIYDLGCANGKEDFINKDVLLDIPIAAFGGNTNLNQLQNSQSNLMDSPTDVLLDKAQTLGQSIIERTLKKSIVQFIPIAGPVMMGTWAKMTTKKISKGSLAFLDDKETYIEHLKPEENDKIKQQLQKEKIKALANLIESNNDINEKQIELIGTIIENSALSIAEKEYYLSESLKTGSYFQLDKNLIMEFEEDDDIIMQLVIMAKRSGYIDEFEKDYIYKVGDEFGFDKSFIDDLL